MHENPVPLSDRTFVALGWRFVSSFSRFAFHFTVGVILARLLPVEAFGLFALSMIVAGLAAVVSEIGLAPALIQRNDLTETHIRVGFTLSTMGGGALTTATWFGAPVLAKLFQTPEVIPVLRLLSFTFLFTSFGITAGALLTRRLDFRKLFWAEMLSYLVGYGGVGVTLGFLDYGVWALAWASVVQSALRAGILFRVSAHPLRPSLAIIEAKQLLHFGVGMTSARLMNYAARNGDYFVVGRWLGTGALGLYSRAYQLMTVPIAEFSSVMSSVLFPVFAEIQNERQRLRKAYLGSVSVATLVVLPLLAGIAIVAPELIRGIFGSKWTGAIAATQVLCIGGIGRCVYNLGDALARAKGAVYAQFLRHLVYSVAVFSASFIGARWGIEGVAVGIVIALGIMYFLMAHLSLKLVEGSWKEFVGAQTPGLILAAFIAAVGFPTTLVLRASRLPDLIILVGTITACAITAVTVALVFPRHWLGEGPMWAIQQLDRMRHMTLRSFLRSVPGG